MRHRCEGTTNNQEARGASSVLTLPSRLLVSSCTLLSLPFSPMAMVESALLAMAMCCLCCSRSTSKYFSFQNCVDGLYIYGNKK